MIPTPADKLSEVARLFARLGITAFGGPAVHIAMMQDEVVRKRGWMTELHFLDLVSATNLIPGPNSTEMTMHVGHERAGKRGLVVAGACFILPAVIITSLLAWAYQRYGQLPEVAPFLYGIKPAILAVVVAAAVRLGKRAFSSATLWAVGVLCAIACIAGANEIMVLFAAAAVGVIIQVMKGEAGLKKSMLPLAAVPNTKVFWIFLKVGAILYGSGYVLFAFLDAELVSKGLLTRQQLADAIAVGQFTPGPVFSAATFIGWQMGGAAGAAAATAGIFLPSFVFVSLLNPIVKRLRTSKVMSAFLDFTNAASVAIIIAVCVEMARESVTDWRTVVIAIASALCLIVLPRLNTAFIVLGGALAGFLLHLA